MPPGDWACCASQRWAAQFVTLGWPRLFLPPKALLIAIAIAGDPRAGLVGSRLTTLYPDGSRTDTNTSSKLPGEPVSPDSARVDRHQAARPRTRHGPSDEFTRLLVVRSVPRLCRINVQVHIRGLSP